MFGLMKSRACSLTAEQRYNRRLHYCGTCKTLGRLYGQKTRLLLNYDTVFLGELLSALSGEDEKLSQWSAAYQSYNCLTLPARSEQMPLALEYAATATVVMAEFKVADQITDSGGFRWMIARRLLSKSFLIASARMKEWRFPFDELRSRLRAQNEIEARLSQRDARQSPDETLNRLAEPTAVATGMVLRHGARLVGSEKSEQAIYRLGYSFGALVYLLDALEDYEKDFRKRQFNALRAAFGISDSRLPKQYRDQVAGRIRSMADEVEAAIYALPMPASRAEQFTLRLKANLSTKLGSRLPVLGHTCNPKAKMTIRERWRAAVLTAKSLMKKHAAARSSLMAARLQAPFVFASVLPVAFMFPHSAMAATSYRECMGMAFNLMLLGSVFAPALAAPHSFSSEIGSAPEKSVPELESGETDEEASGKKRRGRRKNVLEDGGSNRRCGWCDGLECCLCCECADCCS